MTIEIAEYILIGLVALYLTALFLFIGIEERKTNKKIDELNKIYGRNLKDLE